MIENKRLALRWQPEYEDVLEKAERLTRTAMSKNTNLVVRAVLTMLRDGIDPTPATVVDYVKAKYEPRGGWIGFDRKKWLGYVEPITKKLKSDKPMEVFKL